MRKKLMAGPYLLWMLVFTIVPLLFVFYYGFTSSDGTFTFSNITAIFEKIHIQALGLSLLLAVITTVVCLLFAYPLALILSKSAAKNRSFVIFIFILPMWINFLLRIIAIRMLLSDNGILNYILSALNLPNFSIMYTPAAIVIGMVYDYFPFMVLPIYNALIKIDHNLLDAAGRPRRDPGEDFPQDNLSALRARRYKRHHYGVCAEHLGVRYRRYSRRRQGFAHRQYYRTGVQPGQQLASRLRHLDSAHDIYLREHDDRRDERLGRGGVAVVKFRHFLEKFYVAIIFVLLYLPIAVLTVMSFNNSRYMKWGGFTLRWYEDLFTSGPIMEALRNTLLLALLSALIATAVGTLACVGILYMRKRSQSAIMSVNSIPLLNADIVTGIALMLLFVRMFGNLNFTTMLIAHISFNIPYVVLNVLPKLRQRDRNTYEAAVDLGATPVQAFFKVIVPDIFPGILSGFLMAFTMSLDDFTITYFTKGAGIKTLSIIIYTERKLGNQPELYALSTIIFLIVLIVLFAVNRISINKEKSAAKGKNY